MPRNDKVEVRSSLVDISMDVRTAYGVIVLLLLCSSLISTIIVRWTAQGPIRPLLFGAILLVISGVVAFASRPTLALKFPCLPNEDLQRKSPRPIFLALLAVSFSYAYATYVREIGLELLPSWTGTSFSASVVSGMSYLLLIPIAEELYFRGMFHRAVSIVLRENVLRVLVNAVWFAAFHPAQTILPAFVLGAISTLLVLLTGRLYWSVAVHSFSGLALDLASL